MRDQVTQEIVKLVPLSIKDMDMEAELLLQYHTLRSMLVEVQNDSETPYNQKAQVANSLSSVLDKMTQRQIDVYSSERFKKVERLLIRTLLTVDKGLATDFLKAYEAVLSGGN